MIPERAQQIEVDSHVVGAVHDMKLHSASTAHLMDVLATLYSDAQMAVLREAATNARDSHIEAGCPERPIEISLPTALDRCLRIKDYGVGMDAKTIAEVYSQYGASTKRGTNEQNGMLGLGCKSPFAYTSQYSVVAVKDHIRTTISVSREDDGTGSMTILEQVATTEPNGVEVIVPAKEHNQFEAKAKALFKYWPEGSVLVDGQEPKRLTGLQVTDEIVLQKLPQDRWGSKASRQDILVMGGVPYPVEIDVKIKGHQIIAYVPIGSVIPAPARESLKLEAKATKATLARLADEFRESIVNAVQAEVDSAASPFDALAVVTRWREVLPEGGFACKYQGRTVPSEFSAPSFVDDFGDLVTPKMWLVTQTDSRRLADHDLRSEIPIGTALKTLWVTNFTPQRFNSGHKKRLNDFAPGSVTTFVLSEGGFPPNHWINPDRVVDWETIKDETRPAHVTTPRGMKVAGTYDKVDGGGTLTRKIQADAIDTSKPLVFINSTQARAHRRRPYHQRNNPDWYQREVAPLIWKYLPDATVLSIPTNRIDKFRRDFPMAKSAKEVLTEATARLKKGLKRRDLVALRIQQECATDLRHLDPKRIDDPDLVKAVRAAKHSPDKKMINEIRVLDSWTDAVSIKHIEWTNPLDKYPLVDSIDRDPHDHTYLYLNTAFQAEKETI